MNCKHEASKFYPFPENKNFPGEWRCSCGARFNYDPKLSVKERIRYTNEPIKDTLSESKRAESKRRTIKTTFGG